MSPEHLASAHALPRRRLVLLLVLVGLGGLLPSASATGTGAILTLPGAVVAVADDASGATVTYTAKAANPQGKPLPITCVPGGSAKGTLTATVRFRIGTTTVTCTSADVSGSFTVTVVPPSPPPDPAPPPPPSPPPPPPPAAPPPAAPAPPPPPAAPPPPPAGAPASPPATPPAPPAVPADVTPPAPVASVTVRPGDGFVRLTWRLPPDRDFAHVTIVRSPLRGGEGIVYSGAGTTFTDRAVRARVRYRYVLTAYDGAGNASAGIALTASPRRSLLRSPREGARIRSAPVLRWAAVRRATYYNVQVWRKGRKILTAWPARPRYVLQSKWRYKGRVYRLAPGRYRWYVWPGFGARSDARYGNLLGKRTFVIVRS